ncbi:hypothetical protein EV188_11113 [Actinomycetospora succinea]|uniref:PE family protein n=1 Tax=Actinomycetospora succinea TaxID=663603 RepID=A0A4R6UT33_9PSEU|nr:hypothetical protein [Actinomycetospora succinea]TDQ48843.1 hypothetical protein EV188_11113 [Actinomycetospora succinea]
MSAPGAGQGFEVNLADLERCANQSVQQMIAALDQVLAAWPSDPVPMIEAPGTAAGSDLVIAVQGLNGRLLERQRHGREATAATRQALLDIHDVYRRADQQTGASYGG